MVFLWFSFNSPWKPSTSPLLWNSPRDRETFAPRRCHRRTPFSPASPRDSPRQRLVGGFNLRHSYASEKYEFVSWDDDIPNIWENDDIPNIWETLKKNKSKPPTRRGTKSVRINGVLKGFDSLTSEKLGQKTVRLRLGDLKLKLVSSENLHSTRKNNGSEHNNMCVLPANFQTNLIHVGLVNLGC